MTAGGNVFSVAVAVAVAEFECGTTPCAVSLAEGDSFRAKCLLSVMERQVTRLVAVSGIA
jgi:hypothetical protein